jgi:chemotaxis protein methyltransferase CheR
MTDRECVEFLQWALPQLGLRWPGFRKVRRQVHKRIVRRLGELGLGQIADYRAYLDTHAAEWGVLDAMSRISISQFYRDRDVFEHLRDAVLPELADNARRRGEHCIRTWSAGCASGEEPYTIAIIWVRYVRPAFPDITLHVVATDADEQMLQRAQRAAYPASSHKDAPADWLETVFVGSTRDWVLRQEFREQVDFRQQDIRTQTPAESFDLILCRNLAFTYFAEPLQRQVLEQLAKHLVPGGYLAIGKHETIPAGTPGLEPSCRQESQQHRRENKPYRAHETLLRRCLWVGESHMLPRSNPPRKSPAEPLRSRDGHAGFRRNSRSACASDKIAASLLSPKNASLPPRF